jgi:ADP-dependent phosphofructokinase/glucokinase
MSKRDLKKYLKELDKEQLEEQLLELYEKFSDVKTYYDFVFNPKEDKLLQEAKLKVTNEYFPLKGKRAKLRRSVAQKYIKHFLSLGVDSYVVADLMLHNLEVAQKYTARREMRYASFYKSMLNSFEQLVKYSIENGMVSEFKERILHIKDNAFKQNWENKEELERLFDAID